MIMNYDMKDWVTINGKKVRIGSKLTINTGRKNRRVTLQERHMGKPSQICVKYKDKKFLVPKSSVTKIN